MYEIPLKYTKKCRICGIKLGYYEDKKKKRTFKREFYSITPFIFCNIEYYRTMCIDCFVKKHNRLPKPPNIINYDYIDLLCVPKDVIKEKGKKRAKTLDNMVSKYGEEEGRKRFEDYKEKQRYSNTFEYKKENHGWNIEAFNDFNKKRAITLDNMVSKYGEEEGRKKFEDYKEKQRYRGKKKEYFIEKYGYSEGIKKYASSAESVGRDR